MVGHLLFALFCFLFVIETVFSQGCPSIPGNAVKFSSLSLSEGTIVTVESGKTYLYDLESSPILGGIFVDGTLLIPDENPQTLDTKHITVRDGGEFHIGGCNCPHQNKLTITLHGSYSTADPDGVGTKVIGVLNGGKLSIYGEVNGPVWTNLESTAQEGATSITLLEEVDWKVGDKIVVVSTDFAPWQDPNNPENWGEQSEERIVTSVTGKEVTFDEPLKYDHYSHEAYGQHFRGEVLHLTRQIVVQGDNSSILDGFGGHFMFLRGSSVELVGVEVTRCGQFKVLGRYPVHWHMNDQVVLGYAKDNSVHDNFQRAFTIHASNGVVLQRNVAYKTRGHMYFLEDACETGNTLVWNIGVVVYKIKAADQLPGILSDDEPAIFWITNPNNTISNNVAVSSPQHCWWFAMPVAPLGPSYGSKYDMIPRLTNVEKFSHNLAHGCTSDGLHIDRGPNQQGDPGGSIGDVDKKISKSDGGTYTMGDSYVPVLHPTRSAIANASLSNPTVEAIFESFTAYKCRNRGVWTRNAKVTFTHAIFADNAIGITFATLGSGFGKIEDSIFIGETDNFGYINNWEKNNGYYGFRHGNPNPPFRSTPKNSGSNALTGTWMTEPEKGVYYPIRGYEFYDGPNYVKNCRFYGYEPSVRRRASAISMLRDDEFSISQSNKLTQIWVHPDSTPILYPDLVHDGDKASVFKDLDGSLTGRVPSSEDEVAVVTNNLPFLKTPDCVEDVTGEVYHCPNHFAGFFFDMSGATFPSASERENMEGLVALYRKDKVNSPYYVCGGQCNGGTTVVGKLGTKNGFFATLPLYRDYYMHFKTLTPPTTITLRIGNHRHSVNNDGNAPYNELRIAVCLPKGSTLNNVMYNWKDGTVGADSYQTMMDKEYDNSWSVLGNDLWWFDDSTGYLWFRMIIRPSQSEDPTSFGDGCWVRVNLTPGGAWNCPLNGVSEKADTVRRLPPTASKPAVPAFSTPALSARRDDADVCTNEVVFQDADDFILPPTGSAGKVRVVGLFLALWVVVIFLLM